MYFFVCIKPYFLYNVSMMNMKQTQNGGREMKRNKVACVKCDEVNTKAKWAKNGGTCPSCNKSTQGVAE